MTLKPMLRLPGLRRTCVPRHRVGYETVRYAADRAHRSAVVLEVELINFRSEQPDARDQAARTGAHSGRRAARRKSSCSACAMGAECCSDAPAPVTRATTFVGALVWRQVEPTYSRRSGAKNEDFADHDELRS